MILGAFVSLDDPRGTDTTSSGHLLPISIGTTGARFRRRATAREGRSDCASRAWLADVKDGYHSREQGLPNIVFVPASFSTAVASFLIVRGIGGK
ncbi:hypothetical protein TNCV_5041721 [Trichonephila clavipes]|nr:hypothetical protein TNCV_5041721 [Trichonephila clavipes]